MSEKTIPQGLTLTVQIGPKGVAQFQEFLGQQQIAHAEADSLFPGYDFVVGHWPPVDFWEVEVTVGPAWQLIDDVAVTLTPTPVPGADALTPK